MEYPGPSISLERYFTYKKDQLQEIKTVIKERDKAPKETITAYTLNEKDKYGWIKREYASENKNFISERTLILYSEDELKNSYNLYKQTAPNFTLDELITKFRQNNHFRDSILSL